MSNVGDMQRALAGTTGLDRGGEDAVFQLFDLVVPYTKTAADGMASTTTSNTKFWTNPFDFTLRIVGAKWSTTGAGLTADASHYATVSFLTDDAAAGSPAAAASLATTVAGSGSFTAEIAKAMTLTAANCNLVAGGHLYFAIAKTGNGVIVPVSQFALRLRRAG